MTCRSSDAPFCTRELVVDYSECVKTAFFHNTRICSSPDSTVATFCHLCWQ